MNGKKLSGESSTSLNPLERLTASLASLGSRNVNRVLNAPADRDRPPRIVDNFSIASDLDLAKYLRSTSQLLKNRSVLCSSFQDQHVLRWDRSID